MSNRLTQGRDVFDGKRNQVEGVCLGMHQPDVGGGLDKLDVDEVEGHAPDDMDVSWGSEGEDEPYRDFWRGSG